MAPHSTSPPREFVAQRSKTVNEILSPLKTEMQPGVQVKASQAVGGVQGLSAADTSKSAGKKPLLEDIKTFATPEQSVEKPIVASSLVNDIHKIQLELQPKQPYVTLEDFVLHGALVLRLMSDYFRVEEEHPGVKKNYHTPDIEFGYSTPLKADLQPKSKPAAPLRTISPPFEIEEHPIDDVPPLSVIVVGAGISGITAGILFPKKIPNLSLRILEKTSDVVSLSFFHENYGF